jgi:hypothetical protein
VDDVEPPDVESSVVSVAVIPPVVPPIVLPIDADADVDVDAAVDDVAVPPASVESPVPESSDHESAKSGVE